jgi:hypothetical protein
VSVLDVSDEISITLHFLEMVHDFAAAISGDDPDDPA